MDAGASELVQGHIAKTILKVKTIENSHISNGYCPAPLETSVKYLKAVSELNDNQRCLNSSCHHIAREPHWFDMYNNKRKSNSR